MKNNTWLIKNCSYVLTRKSGHNLFIKDVDIKVKDGIISEIESNIQHSEDENLIDGHGCAIYPGIVNTHHHLFQSLLKAVPGSMNLKLGEWLKAIPGRFARAFDEDLLRIAIRIGLRDLLLTGATACADHHYLYFSDTPNNISDIIFDEVDNIGIKFVLCRGFNLKKRSITNFDRQAEYAETSAQFFSRTAELIEKYHQITNYNTHGVVVAPGTPFHSCDFQMLPEIANFARSYGIRMHSHLSETYEDYVQFSIEKFNKRPAMVLNDSGWLGPDVWYAHVVHVSSEEIRILGDTGTGVSHCPTSNARLGTGVAPIMEMMSNGVPISIGVDGAASAETSDALNELRTAGLLQKTQHGPVALDFFDLIEIGSINGAKMIGLNNTGTVEVGKAADLVVYDISKTDQLGFHQIELSPLLSSGKKPIKASFINGQLVVYNNEVIGIDFEKLLNDQIVAVKLLENHRG